MMQTAKNESQLQQKSISLNFLHVAKSHPFLPFWLGQALYVLGNTFFAVSLTIAVYRITKTGMGLSVLQLLRYAPLVLFGPIAGSFVDWVSKRQIMAGCNLIFSLICLLLVFTTSLWQIYILVFIYMLSFTLYKPTRYASIPELIPQNAILIANSFIMCVDEIVNIIGSSLVAILSTSQNQYSFYISFFVLLSATVIFGFNRWKEPDRVKMKNNELNLYPLKDCCVGWQYLRGHKFLFPLAFVVAMIWLSLGMFLSIIIIFVKNGLNCPESYYGYLLSVYSCGNIFGFLISPLLVNKLGISRLKIFSVGYLFAGLFVMGISRIYNVWLSLVFIFFMATCSGASNSIEETLEQEMPCQEHRGKVISFISTIGTLGYLFGITLGPICSDIVGVRTIVFFSALFLFLTSYIIKKFINDKTAYLDT
jgi:MFS family permease